MIGKMMKMQQVMEDDDDLVATGTARRKRTVSVGDGRPAWMRQLNHSIDTWLNMVPKTLQTLQRTMENIKDPLYRCFEREVNSGAKLLVDLRRDLADVAQVSAPVRVMFAVGLHFLLLLVVVGFSPS